MTDLKQLFKGYRTFYEDNFVVYKKVTFALLFFINV